MRKIYLVGFMGSGKSAIGRRLSYLLKMPYYDMDHEIVRQQGMTIPQIFEKYGEARFREIETEFLKKFRDEACIISTGGGVAINAENRKIMRRSGLVFFLDATFEDIYKRIQHDPNRPIVQSSTKEELEKLYHYRRRFYRETGHIQVLTEGRTLRQILEYLVFQVKRLKGEH
ncbi:shikimate kinase [Lysinibacillus xylanilyticus]|uniref:Shikimate kinase n=1 Tax=Lysinibacillus xylanilyticus TaxID=582475 RepID=A0ABT4EVJ9_9BACI|nr:shikimate kinase [Lysinibacillus xylanilyticus]MCY9549563.1 shikimate kinase [Lysinibacillus xylanilyticus]MED3803165.1 shikimate kinase [Lysinibacillus xylanilyticus]